MQTTDWKFDFSKLPRWENHDLIPFIYDDFTEISQSDMLCCIYSVAEVSMCNYEGFLAIIKNKEKPELFLNVSENMTFCDNISVSPKGNLIFLQPNIKKNNSIKRPILIIDTEKSAFAYFDTNNVNCCYKIIQIHESVYKVEADAYQKKSDKRLRALSRKKIRINRLKWRNLTEFHS